MEIFKKIFDDEKKRLIIIVFALTFSFGFLAHGFVMFNKLCFHDESRCITDIGQTINLGRWMLYVLKVVTEFVFGSALFSTPFFNALVSLFFISLIVLDIIMGFNIKSRLSIAMICGITE